MKRFQTWRSWVAILSVLVIVGAVRAQDFDPVSSTPGYARTELNRIYNRDIGTGYSGESLNRIALRNAMSSVPNVGQTTTSPGPRTFSSPVGSPLDRPFSNYSPEPTTSPYLNLFREDFEGNSDLNYHTLVRPQLQQQQFQQSVQRQNMAIGQRLQELSAQHDFSPRGSEQQLPTGHQTVFMYHGRYYPALGVRRGR